MIEITLCLLTLNEINFIEDCIKHHKPFVNYIVAVDGDSTDGTKEILDKYCDYWMIDKTNDDFAYLRNLLHELAPTDWCLHVDADERFDLNFLKQMRELIEVKGVLCFRFPRVNLDATYPIYEVGDYQVRLINKKFAVWKRKVHEIVYYRYGDKPLDQYPSYVYQVDYPIIHLKKPRDIRVEIQERWNKLSRNNK